MSNKLLTPKEAAAILNTELRTLENWRYIGKGPKYLKFGGRFIRYNLEDLEAFIAENTISPVREA